MSTKTPSAVVSFNAVPEDAADPDVKVYVNGELIESGGGGGGGDLSTAIVTLTIAEGCSCFLPYCNDGNNDPEAVAADTIAYYSGEYNVVLYKGEALLSANDLSVVSAVSGDAEQDATYTRFVHITGDCSITIASGGIG